MIELIGLVFFVLSITFGLVSLESVFAFFVLSFGAGFLLSVGGIMIDEITFRTYPRTRDLLMLVLGAVVENFGYRQLNSIWRLEGTIKWLLRTKSSWGVMTRSGGWSDPENEPAG